MLAPLPPAELGQLRGFYASCQELESNTQLMLDSAEPAMIFHVLVVGVDAAQAGSMFPGDPGESKYRTVPYSTQHSPPAGDNLISRTFLRDCL